VLPTKHLFGHRDHDDSCDLPARGGGWPIHRSGHSADHVLRSGIPAFEASPCCRSYGATAEFVVVNLITQQNPQPDAELTCSRHARFAYAFLLKLPPIESLQPVVTPRGVHGRFAPHKPQKRFPCFVSRPKRCRLPLEYSLGIRPT